MTRILVVDDSALMRRHLVQLLEREGFTVRTARNGVEALAQVEAFDPQVVTLDVNMPEMDGITCLSRIMVGSPRPVVMVSSITERAAEATLQALSLGAVDYVRKPDGTISLEAVAAELVAKVRVAAKARVKRPAGASGPVERQRPAPEPARSVPTRARAGSPGLVLLGVSTGGPAVLETILPALSATLPWPVLVAQHMPGSFTGVFARRLDALCALTVEEVRAPTPLRPGHVYIARGDADMLVTRRAAGLIALSIPASEQHAWHPSVTRLVDSAAEQLAPEQLIGVQLTGMGDDGAEAMARQHRRGMRTIAQDADSSAVFGMPQELIRRAGATVVLPSDRIAAQITRWLVAERHAAPSPFVDAGAAAWR
ncbi:chemotaxis-specific protein-glutamate methyltransferase CheB [Sphingomonas sp. BK345]|uniref:chemotaxis-specific protein-glutamate methyltransferase CheB n=1 Tax=Sphingomonas sp. BK345 TaxID=2586980 RepID=UPI0016179ABD|nr:chemotaxis-specific protein-glutamate methyltransferase CheB [Sphingomonas sp. BK345]MBB3471920.1 two-component system chemotaxis response regulator CheB [Sphingomonas sp. BK345]